MPSRKRSGPWTSRMPEATRTVLRVDGPAAYDVHIGVGVLAELAGLVADSGVSTLTRVALVHPASVSELASRCAELLANAGVRVLMMPVPDAEAAKTAEVALTCWEALGSAGFTRSDWIVGIGGGATTDLAGFVAATWLRGVRFVSVPTSLLGMVDAAVGGKTGINTREGKNLVGAFYEPLGVICDLDLLRDLPRRDLVAGLGEIIKAGFIRDPRILALVEGDHAGATDPESPVLRELVERSIQVKADVVSADLRETTSTGRQVGRELLNYGHTLAHAIERREHFRWRHGDAVSVGMVFVAELARQAGLLDRETAERHVAILGAVGLPTAYDAGAFDDLLVTMGLDKKTRGSTLRFVVLNGLASAEILAGPPEDLLRSAYAAVAR